MPLGTVLLRLPDRYTPELRAARLLDIESRCLKTSGGCWLYGKPRGDGYGLIYAFGHPKRQAWPAHRYMWALAHGEIPCGLYVCHSCDVRNCVNPDHLWLGTTTDNQRDRVAKGRHRGCHALESR